MERVVPVDDRERLDGWREMLASEAPPAVDDVGSQRAESVLTRPHWSRLRPAAAVAA